MKQRLAVLGSTGSIGVQTLDVVGAHRDMFEITVLTARRNWQMLARQAVEFDADCVVIADESLYDALSEALSATDVKVYAGARAMEEVVRGSNVDVVVNALVGYAGLLPTVAAVETGKKVALANKETLVVGGELVMRLAAENRAPILPVDSEHSAIFQCLAGEHSPVRRLILTASGGAFRDLPIEALENVTAEEALRHPNWSMGAKITIDCATMVNKGFEVIEARWLFDVAPEQIDVMIHPQSIVHSMVEFEDGSVKAQLGRPDMRLPISYALSFPYRLRRDDDRLDLLTAGALTFKAVDRVKYPALDIAYDSLRRGGTAACTMNGANEVAVAAFLGGRIRYNDIVAAIGHALGHCGFVARPSLEDYAACDAEARRLAAEYIARAVVRK